ELPRLQPAPYASLSFGGAGTAYALYRLGDRRRARAWLAATLADRRDDAYYSAPVHGDRPVRPGSLLFGAMGARWVHALLDRRADASLVRALRGRDGFEFASGIAGQLVALALLNQTRRSQVVERAL